MSGKWTLEEVASKIDWEGGIIETLHWGLTSDMIADEALAGLWKQLEDVKPLIDAIGKIVYSVDQINDE